MATIKLENPTNYSATIPTFPFGAAVITPHDTDLFDRPVAVYIGVAGDIKVRPACGCADITFKNFPAGSMLPVMAKAVRSTGTTATNLVACY